MISIRESIIGRKGISSTPILQQGDIIITRINDIYMVLTDRRCLKKILHPDSYSLYDMSKGAYARIIRDYPSFMNLSSFNNKLEHTEGSDVYDIVQVWRSPWSKRINSNDDIVQIIQIENLKRLKNSYKLIWER